MAVNVCQGPHVFQWRAKGQCCPPEPMSSNCRKEQTRFHRATVRSVLKLQNEVKCNREKAQSLPQLHLSTMFTIHVVWLVLQLRTLKWHHTTSLIPIQVDL